MNELTALSAYELNRKLLAREVSAVEIAEAQIKRAEALEEKISAYNTLTSEQALAKAKDIDARLDAKKPVGPLAGVPVAIKDNMCTRGVRTTCSSRNK